MISCVEFIPAYSSLFKSLEKWGGKEAVVDFWNHLSDRFLTNLRELVEKHGLEGCWLYWSKNLNEEAADFHMELDDESQVFSIEMRHCPSKGMLLSSGHVAPYHDYCGHCAVLYPRALGPLGFDSETDLSQTDDAKCSLLIRPRKRRPAQKSV